MSFLSAPSCVLFSSRSFFPAATIAAPPIVAYMPAVRKPAPICFIFAPSAERLANLTEASCPLKVFSLLSASMMFLLTRMNSLEVFETPCAFSCFSMSRNCFSSFSVASTFCPRSVNFCLRSSALVGLNFRARLTALRSLSTPLESFLIVLSALSSLVVSPLNSIVMPFIAPAIFISYPRRASQSA